MVDGETIFTRKDFNEFRRWVNIDIDSVTWHGEKLDDFENFWFSFFLDGLSLGRLTDQFEYIIFKSKSGPLASWFRWMFEKFICFSFINKDISVYQLARETKLSLPQAAYILRNFFVDFYPHLRRPLSNTFQISNIVDDNINVKYNTLKRELSMEHLEFGTQRDDMMASLEAAIYPEWKKYFSGPKRHLFNAKTDVQKMRIKASLKDKFVFLRDLGILFTAGFLIFVLVEKANKAYEKYLIDKINISGPKFQWSDEELSFQEEGTNDISGIPLSVDNLDGGGDREVSSGEGDREERFETESEVALTSIDNLPKNIDAADRVGRSRSGIQSYRDSIHGTTKVYRVMMRSTDIIQSREKLDQMMKTYSISRVERERVDTYVPGGLYYNIFVPRTHTSEFLAQVMEMDQSIRYEIRTKATGNRPGEDKVFIWVHHTK